ncbi:hypothetical protein SAMN02745751_03489 [Dethiosulfatibacter aminovorans DSM 17477]|uniref:Short C-terminal domain-containing protein n=1 Tax=Dethiosulfatibacter aminovorans DSM 17477 TaxID=1121476 RepID=A0A1M6MIY6_9FIRM|nr:hypothetical protein [Dethiosulfatibacter aminovorans]SHJ83442.1 hypothetical protein SAMN02745751_03489 [Dethiosulfatibacter aminovorans DSM 17477]
MMFIFPILIGVVLYYFYSNNKENLIGNKSPEDILKERFINGEIDEATYLQMKETLKN